jgi:hypothetical protein
MGPKGMLFSCLFDDADAWLPGADEHLDLSLLRRPSGVALWTVGKGRPAFGFLADGARVRWQSIPLTAELLSSRAASQGTLEVTWRRGSSASPPPAHVCVSHAKPTVPMRSRACGCQCLGD